MRGNDYGLVFWIHLILNIVFISSWLFFSWWFVLICMGLIQLQFIIFKGCILSKLEFKKDEACIPYYLYKWKLIKNKKLVRFIVGRFMPLAIIAMSALWQIVFGIKPILF